MAQYISVEEMAAFKKAYHKAADKLVNLGEGKCLSEAHLKKWFKALMDYNVPRGKFFRAQLAVCAGLRLNNGNDPLHADRIYTLAWATEMLHTAGLISDDIMDRSTLRRGQKCWYLLNDVGMSAVNDVLALENAAFRLLAMVFDEDDLRYQQMTRIFHDIAFRTTYGQALDMHTENTKDFSLYTMDLYEEIAINKTAYYTFHLPVVVGMIVAGVGSRKFVEAVKPVLLKLGILFQIQDDYLDVFGDVDTIGKDGTDIANGKCAWPFVKALELANEEQREQLLLHYGKNCPSSVSTVKDIFGQLQLQEVYADYEDETLNSLINQVENISEEFPFKDFLVLLIKLTFGRVEGEKENRTTSISEPELEGVNTKEEAEKVEFSGIQRQPLILEIVAS